MRRILGLPIALILTASAAAQEPSTRFRSGVDLVALNVAVTDGEGNFVGGLARTDFVVTEDGVPQDITYFAAVPTPIDLALLLDTSSSMSDKLTTVQEAAIGFTTILRAGDRIAVVDIKDSVKTVHPLDEDVNAARAAIKQTTTRGNTSLYNGLYLTLRDLVKNRMADSEVRRQAIVVLSDGDDTSSLVAFDDVMDLAKQSGVAIYTITLRSPLNANLFARDRATVARSEFSMKALAQETGARSFFPEAITGLTGVYSSIAKELASQYSLAYASTNVKTDGSYRRVNVRLERPGAVVRTRAGYVAAPASAIAVR